MEQNSIYKYFANGAVSNELITLFNHCSASLTIGELAKMLSLSRKETLLLLVTLESQGVLTWNEAAKTYTPDPQVITILLNGAIRSHTRHRRDKAPRVQKLAKAA